jgi:N-acetylglutamate synthase-like GNAT family acetyltransferase
MRMRGEGVSENMFRYFIRDVKKREINAIYAVKSVKLLVLTSRAETAVPTNMNIVV